MPRKFSRQSDYRRQLLRNLATSLILYEKIVTTSAKAKEIRPIVERLVNIGKLKNLQAHRRLNSYLTHPNAVKKIIEVLAPRFDKKTSGYLQIIHYQPRHGDNAPQDIIQFIKLPVSANKETEKAKHDHQK